MYGYEHYSWSPWINPQATIDHHKPSVDSGRYTLFVNYEKTFYCNDDIIIVWNDWFYDITRHTSGQDSMHFGPAFDTIWIRGSLRSFSIANIQPLSLARAKRSNALFYLNYDTTVIYLYTFWARFEICKLKCTENLVLRFSNALSMKLCIMSTMLTSAEAGCRIIDYWHKVRFSLEWRHKGRAGVSNHQPRDCLLRRISKKTSKLCVTDLY